MTDEKDMNIPENQGEGSADEMLDQASGDAVSTGSEDGSEQSAEVPDGDAESFDKIVNEDDVPEDDAEAAMLAMLNDLPEDAEKSDLSEIDFPSDDPQSVSNVEFQHLSEPAGNPEVKNIDMLMDVNLPIAIELGRTKMSISDILALGPGSVVELNKLAGEPVELLVNQRVVAKGEVVVIDENFGVRITQLLTPEERLKALGEEH
ncbi:MAG: flagellar motor switch protein FliN [Calditrichaeota bacterium]|nr:MAG: flagellar motor switch protein FliN [Calditrichota bacterium]